MSDSNTPADRDQPMSDTLTPADGDQTMSDTNTPADGDQPMSDTNTPADGDQPMSGAGTEEDINIDLLPIPVPNTGGEDINDSLPILQPGNAEDIIDFSTISPRTRVRSWITKKLKYPMRSVVAFDNFNARLITDEKFLKRMANRLSKHVEEGDKLKVVLRKMFRRLLTTKLLLRYTFHHNEQPIVGVHERMMVKLRGFKAMLLLALETAGRNVSEYRLIQITQERIKRLGRLKLAGKLRN